jgi:hypothetical protein
MEVPAGAYRITMNINDGARAWIDDVLIVDDWRSGPTRTVNAAVDLVAGVHSIRIEYFNLECPAGVSGGNSGQRPILAELPGLERGVL